VRAVDAPVTLLTIPRADFLRVMEESPVTAEAIGKIVQKRLEAQKIKDQRTR
jgi:CRP-like cAMP-binding protein